jgi:hypothetical protein
MAVLVVIPGAVASRSVQAQSRVSVETEANAYIAVNPFLVADDDRVTLAGEVVVRPKATWSIGTGRTTAELDSEIAFRQYDRRYGNFVTGRAIASVAHRHSEYWTLRGAASYVRELPTEATSTFGAVFDAVSVSERAALRTSFEWNLNSRTAISTDLGWENTRYPGSSILASTTAYEARAGITRRFSRVTTAGLQVSYIASRAGDEGNSTTAAAQVTVNRALSLGWRLEAAAGVERSTVTELDGRRRLGPGRFSGTAQVCYEPNHLRACLSGSVRSVVSGLGGLQREVSFRANVRRQLSEHASVVVAADYVRANVGPLASPADQPAISTDLLRVSGEYRHRISRGLSVTSGLSYLRRNDLSGQRVSGATFRIGIVYQGFGQ